MEERTCEQCGQKYTFCPNQTLAGDIIAPACPHCGGIKAERNKDSDNMIFHNFALDVHAQYEAFMAAGFTEGDAMKLTLAWVSAIAPGCLSIDPDGNIAIE
jgi:hypothetical protein